MVAHDVRRLRATVPLSSEKAKTIHIFMAAILAMDHLCLISGTLFIHSSQSECKLQSVPQIKSFNCRSLILDGEMMVWDPEIEKYLPFGNLKTSALGERTHC